MGKMSGEEKGERKYMGLKMQYIDSVSQSWKITQNCLLFEFMRKNVTKLSSRYLAKIPINSPN